MTESEVISVKRELAEIIQTLSKIHLIISSGVHTSSQSMTLVRASNRTRQAMKNCSECSSALDTYKELQDANRILQGDDD